MPEPLLDPAGRDASEPQTFDEFSGKDVSEMEKSASSLEEMRKDDLVALAEKHDVDSSGTKAEIAARLEDAGVEPE